MFPMNLRLLAVPLFLFTTIGLAAQTVYPNTDLGQVALGAAPATGTLSFPISGNPTFSHAIGCSDFALGSAACNGTTCTVPITFTPSHAGFRKDAVIVRDESQLLGWMQVSGTGLGPVAQLSLLARERRR